MKTERGQRIRALIDRLRHEGIGEEEVYEELADRLMAEHAFNRVFHDVFASEAPSSVEAGRLRRFYEDFVEGAYDAEEAPGPT